MLATKSYQGINQFGKAYQIMLENDTHAPGSVDRVLMGDMIRLCSETTDYLYSEYTPTKVLYEKGSRPDLERYLTEILKDWHSQEELIEHIARLTCALGKNVSDDLSTTVVGGTEEEIIRRGSDWCTDVARAGCVLCQIAGLPARLIYLVDVHKAYSGHVIIEVYRSGVWGAVDVVTNVIYRHPQGKPATTWNLMNNPPLIESHWRDDSTLYTKVSQFQNAAIANYFVGQWKDYDYTVSRVNNYYRAVLEMSAQGWPGRLRWLHGEDK